MRFVKRGAIAISVTVLLLLGLMVGGVSAASDSDSLFGTVRTVFEAVEKYHKDGADLQKFIDGAIEGGLEALGDPYTNYFPKDEFQSFMNGLSGTVEGIGVYLEQEGDYVVVAAPIPGSPAMNAGLQTGDRFLEADGQTLVGKTIEYAQSLIKGKEGTAVTLRMERPAEHRTFTVTITRAVVVIPQVESRMVGQGVGYVSLAGFTDESPAEFFAAVKGLKEQGATGLVVDLRQNPGGYVTAAVAIASGWVPKGEPVMIEVGKDGQQVHKSAGTLVGLPTVVLVDNGTASAAEILAGAIQDYGVGQLVGTKTFGKGTVQQILFLSGGDGLKVTTAEYLTAKGNHVHGIGLTPDEMVEPVKPDAQLVEPLALERNLKPNMVGLDVQQVQTKLGYLGYDVGTEGYFTWDMADGVRRFAREHGLNPEPVVDGAFAAELDRLVAWHLASDAVPDVQLNRAVQLLTAAAH